jgi:hypothetical protein
MPITIRAHHIGSAKALFRLSKENILSWLIDTGYIQSQKDPFIETAYELKTLFESQGKIKLQIGGLDFVCEKCPKYKNSKCNPNKPQEEIVGRTFLMGNYEGPLSDTDILNKYHLSLEKEYTPDELRKIMNF